MTYSIYFNKEDVTTEGFPQGYPLEREVAFLLWWVTGDDKLFVPAFRKYHIEPSRCNMEEDRGTLVGIKEVDTGVFEVFKH